MKYLIIFLLCTIGQNTYAQKELNVLSRWSNSTVDSLQNQFLYYNEVWGVAINGREYAIIGSILGSHIVDITDPKTPIELFFVEGEPGGIHRDYHNYKNYLYMVCGENGTLQIADLQYLPDSLPIVYDSPELIAVSHNIFIDSTNAKLYHCGGLNNGAVTIYDISDPANPFEINSYTNFAGKNIFSSHDVFVKNDTAYINVEENGLLIVDFSADTANTIGILPTEDYPFSGYNHSGWLSPDSKTYVMADETNDKDVKIFDVSNLPEIEVLATINPGTGSTFLAHNPIIKDNNLFISFYQDGLQIWDISSPANPIKTHYFIPPTNPNTWGVYPFLPSGNILISDFKGGLFVLEALEPTINTTIYQKNIQEIDIFPNPTTDYISIEHLTLNDNAKYEILDMLGHKMAKGTIPTSKKTHNTTIPIDLKTGSYIINIASGDNNYTGKIIVKIQ